mgnify:CR=1 FL=1
MYVKTCGDTEQFIANASEKNGFKLGLEELLIVVRVNCIAAALPYKKQTIQP